MSDASHQLPYIDTDNTYVEYQEAQYWAERERKERRWDRRILRKLHRLADGFDNRFGWFFCPRRFN